MIKKTCQKTCQNFSKYVKFKVTFHWIISRSAHCVTINTFYFYRFCCFSWVDSKASYCWNVYYWCQV